MQNGYGYARPASATSAIQINQVLRNTYALLSMTLLFSAAMAFTAMQLKVPFINPWLVIGGYFALLFLTAWLRNSVWGLLSVFALTGFMGFTLGPVLNAYIQGFANGGQLVAMSLGGAGVVFLAMSGIALTTKRDFSGMGKFLMVGIIVAFLAGLGALFFQLPALSLAVSAMFTLLMAGLILYQTQQIVRGGETNYIMATVTLYVSIYNLFTSLLHLLGFFFGEE